MAEEDKVLDPVADYGMTAEGYPEEMEKEPELEVPFFGQLMTSTDDDTWLGQDEAGNKIYRTMLGQVYTVKPDEDQRTTRAKIQEDLIPAFQEWLQDPVVPTIDDVMEFSEDFIAETYGAMERASTSSGTMGDSFVILPALGAAGAVTKAPKGSLRLFAGRNAEKFSRDIERAENMKEAGRTAEEIWMDTGLEFNRRSGKWEWEIDSKGMELIRDDDTFEKLADKISNGQDAKLPDLIKFKELFENYPEFKDTIVKFDPKLKKGEAYFLPNNKESVIGVSVEDLGDVKEFRKNLLHEIQHGIQLIEEFPTGSSPKNFLEYDSDSGEFFSTDLEVQRLLNQHEDFLEAAAKRYSEITGVSEDKYLLTPNEISDFRYETLMRGADEKFKQARELAFKKYEAVEGEVQSRAAEERDALSSYEKAVTTPSNTYNSVAEKIRELRMKERE